MAFQLLSILGSLARGAALSLPRAAKSFVSAGLALRRPPGQPAQFNLSQLARQLGTPNPSPAQIATNQQQIAQQNQQFAMSTRLANASGHVGGGIGELGKFSAALTVAEKGLTALAHIINEKAVDSLKIYSATMAAEAAKQGRFAMSYNQERAKLVSGSTTALGDSLRQNSQAWQPHMALAENITNALLKVAVDLSTKLAGLLEATGLTQMANNINAWFNKNENKNIGVLHEVVRGAITGRHAGPLSGRPNEQPGSRM